MVELEPHPIRLPEIKIAAFLNYLLGSLVPLYHHRLRRLELWFHLHLYPDKIKVQIHYRGTAVMPCEEIGLFATT